MKTQKVPGQVPETMAGPKERAGLMEHPAAAEQATSCLSAPQTGLRYHR